MKLMHKVTALLLVLTMMLAMSGCFQSSTPTTEPDGTGIPTVPGTTAPAETSEPIETTLVTQPTETTAPPIITPSVAQKGAPLLDNFDNAAGDTVIAVIHDENGEEQASMTRDEFKVIAMSERNDETVATPEQKEELESAYDSLTQAKSLEELVPGLPLALASMESNLTVNDLAIRDLFHVEPPERALELLSTLSGSTMTLVFNLPEIMVGDFVAFLQYTASDDTWHVVNPETVEILENGKVSAEFLVDVGTLAILVEKP